LVLGEKIMDWSLATDKQVQTIINHDGQCPPSLLYQALEEAVRRDLYNHYMWAFVTKRFKAVRFAEYVLDIPFDELKLIFYTQAFNALEKYKPGKNSFLSFWTRFMNSKLRDISRDRKAGKRQGETVSMESMNREDEESYETQLVSDLNVERLVINRMVIAELLSKLSPLEKEVILWREKGYDFKEIGERLGFSTSYMNKAHKVALAKMKEGA
jgi:RNA polymerase sigma factor (sigma-70 family)